MGVTIQAESHRVELAGLYEYEHDDKTLEFYDQPPAIKLIYTATNGRQVGVWHTLDYFVIRSEAIGWEEWKTEAGLEWLAETMPHGYVRDEVGRWRCPPGESFAEPFGLFYRLRSSAEIDWVFQRNLRLLEDCLGVEGPASRSPRPSWRWLSSSPDSNWTTCSCKWVRRGSTTSTRCSPPIGCTLICAPRLHTRWVGAAHRRRRSYRSV
jgi:hypothetical protein